MASQQQTSNTPIASRDSWQTPQWLFDYIAADHGPFDFDLAASISNAKVSNYVTEREDSLSCDWHSLALTYGRPVGFCNPPYSETGKWLEKGKIEAQHSFKSVFLVPTPNGDSYWRHVFGWATEIIFIHGRISFELPNENGLLVPKAGNTRGSCIVVFDEPGEQDTQISWVDRDTMKALMTQQGIN